MRIAFAGTPEFAVPALQGLIDHGKTVVGVWTQPDRPAGRGRKLTPSPVKQAAIAAGIPVHQPPSLKDPESQQILLDCGADLFVVAAYGLLLPQAIIEGFKLGCVNLHGSILPRWRGAAPIQRAVQAGDRETGVGLMRMELGLDTGPVIGEMRTSIELSDTASSVHDRLAAMGWPLLQRHWQELETFHPGVAQDSEGIEYAAKISKAEAQINFDRPCIEVIRHIHAFNPAPGAWVDGPLGRVKLLNAEPSSAQHNLSPGQLGPDGQVGCSDGQICVTRWQLPGAKAQDVHDLINAGKLPSGQLLQTL